MSTPDHSGCASTRGGSAVYNATFRIMWGVGVGLLVILCDLGFGSLAHVLLSSKPLHVIAKLSYCIYIFHYNVIILWEQTLMDAVYVDEFALAWYFMAISTAATAIAAIMYLFYEMPIATLWSYVMVALVGHSNRKRDEGNDGVKENQVSDKSENVEFDNVAQSSDENPGQKLTEKQQEL